MKYRLEGTGNCALFDNWEPIDRAADRLGLIIGTGTTTLCELCVTRKV